MSGVEPEGHVNLAGVKRDAASRRIVAEWRRLTGWQRSGLETPRGTETLIACSGGADSTALLLALAASEPEQIAVAHILHDMRPAAEVEADRDFVRDLTQRLGLEYLQGQASIRTGPAAVPRGNLEAAARRVRYAELARLAEQAGTGFIAAAHQADDQLESIVMALLRGAGPRGMRGIAPSRRLAAAGAGGTVIRLVRPMLSVRRADAERICSIAGVTWREDQTNLDVSRLRAAVRHEVLPTLLRLRPRASEHGASTARLMREAQQVIDVQTAALVEQSETLQNAVSWPRRAIAAGSALLVGEALRAAVMHLQGARRRDRLTHRALAPVVEAIRDASTEPRRFTLAGVIVTVTAHTVTASKRV